MPKDKRKRPSQTQELLGVVCDVSHALEGSALIPQAHVLQQGASGACGGEQSHTESQTRRKAVWYAPDHLQQLHSRGCGPNLNSCTSLAHSLALHGGPHAGSQHRQQMPPWLLQSACSMCPDVFDANDGLMNAVAMAEALALLIFPDMLRVCRILMYQDKSTVSIVQSPTLQRVAVRDVGALKLHRAAAALDTGL